MHRNFRPRFTRPTRKLKAFDPSQHIKLTVAAIPEPTPPTVIEHTFTDFGLALKIQENISSRGYLQPTPIQDKVIPLILTGQNVVGIANTGTGKTASFLIPLINQALSDRTHRVLILAPTRELALQIDQEFRLFARSTGLRSAACIGGVGMRGQIRDLSLSPNFIIGTPGRIKDLGERGKIHFGSINHVVLDEVDRMLDMGFIRDMTSILTLLPSLRQSAFFSATLPAAVQQIMRKYLTNPTMVSVATSNNLGNITQDVIRTHGKAKIDILHQLLIREEFEKVLVFGRTKWGLKKLALELERRGFRVEAIHGNRTQNQRQRSLELFKRNQVRVLLATDVASRGLDIDDITHVINYDLPESYEDYIHRIGRTGRASKTGIALTLV